MYKIGVLLPRSTFYGSIGFDIAEGIKAGFKHLQREDIEIVIENIGFGSEKQLCYQAAENLLLKADVQIVVAYLGQRMAQLLRPLFMSANRLLVVLDAGANMPQEWPVSNNIIYHSLHDSLCCWMSSKLAIRDGHKKGGMVTCYYDGGYLHTFGISQSFVNDGGEITFNHATGYTKDAFSMAELDSHLEKNPDSCLLSIFSANYTQWFFEKLNDSVKDKNPKIYASSFMMEENMLSQLNFPDLDVKGVVSWSKELQNEQNKYFLESMENIGREANLFSLIAWESTSLIIECVKLLDENSKKVASAVQHLKTFSFESPRGKITFDTKSMHSLSPLYEAALIEDETGMSKLKIVQELKEVEKEFGIMQQIELNGVISGWYNSYTCI